MKQKIEKSLVIEILNEDGLHARPSASFVKTANEFKSEIFVEKDNVKVNGKSILGIMMLSAGIGSKLKVTAYGTDAVEAIEKLKYLANNKFGELK